MREGRGLGAAGRFRGPATGAAGAAALPVFRARQYSKNIRTPSEVLPLVGLPSWSPRSIHSAYLDIFFTP